jgi:hypothetical protein
VTVEGEFALDRTDHDTCFVSVPARLTGKINLEADFTTGTLTGNLSGTGAGDYTMPAPCEHGDETTDYDLTHLTTWTATTAFNTAFSGPFNPDTGEFRIEVNMNIAAEGHYAAPGYQYMCYDDTQLQPVCRLPDPQSPQPAVISGTIHPDGSTGEIDWYTNYCVSVAPDS